jgi:type IV pilus assembly protein PilN
MRIQLNLATHPFVELGPLYARLRMLIALLAITALPLWLLLSTEKRKADEAHARLAAVQNQIAALNTEQSGFESQMHQPKNAAILSQSQFLNQLFARKAFSWTAVMMDLETVLPGGVQVMNIDPVIAKNGKVTVRLRVSGAHDRAVDLIRNLEHSHRFLSPRLADEAAESSPNGQAAQQVSTNANVNFDLLAEYNPLPEAAKATSAKGQKTGPVAGKPSSQSKPNKHKPRAAKKAVAQ